MKKKAGSVKPKKENSQTRPELFCNELTNTKKPTKYSMTTKHYGLLIRNAKNDYLPEIKSLNESEYIEKRTDNKLAMIGVKYVQPEKERKIRKSVERVAPIKIVTRIDCSQRNELGEKKSTVEEPF
eukprot:TRINITY_DN11327_c0_g1_i1.p1 TRINITY_DN11327_c0_g1~~TRINITY_DN11327_c0_g1_i1.p1  ORF type:complete len:126 (-),score=19.23 TRINITY_DN11327_c0_g1_i1:63-440(-)